MKSACDTLRRFECPEASPSGMTCEDSLSRLLEVGTITTTRLSCISGAQSADQMPTCHVKCAR